MKLRLFKKWWGTLVLVCIFVTTVAPAAAACTCPEITDNAIIDRAKTGVGSPYWWGHGCWDTTKRSWGGADCSGFAAKVWQVPKWTANTTDYHPYSTWDFYWTKAHWYAISRDNLWKGDTLVWRNKENTGGHIVVYYYGDPWGSPYVYEARGKDYGIVFNSRSFPNYDARRRHNLINTYGPA